MADEIRAAESDTSLTVSLHPADDLRRSLESLRSSTSFSSKERDSSGLGSTGNASSDPELPGSITWSESLQMPKRLSFGQPTTLTRFGSCVLHSELAGAEVCPFDGVKYRKSTFAKSPFRASWPSSKADFAKWSAENGTSHHIFSEKSKSSSPDSGLDGSFNLDDGDDSSNASSEFKFSPLSGDIWNLRDQKFQTGETPIGRVSSCRMEKSFRRQKVYFSKFGKTKLRSQVGDKSRKSSGRSSPEDGPDAEVTEVTDTNGGSVEEKENASEFRRGLEEKYEHYKHTCKYNISKHLFLIWFLSI